MNDKAKIQIGDKLRAERKVRTIPTVEAERPYLRKPDWIRVRVPNNGMIDKVRNTVHSRKLHTVCEEAACPNLPECFGHGTATFMIMGDICTRRCPFCDVGHGRPNPLDPAEPDNLAATIAAMGLNYVVITSVDRDDLRDGGAAHFVACIEETRRRSPAIRIEVLVPDFRGRLDVALDLLAQAPPDVFNHNLETVPRLYRQARPGAEYRHSLELLQRFRQRHPRVPTKSGLMLGLGETLAEVEEVMRDLRLHEVDMLTLGQYLQPSAHHLPLQRYVTPAEFDALRVVGEKMGFTQVASGPMVRSSYHADLQARSVLQPGNDWS